MIKTNLTIATIIISGLLFSGCTSKQQTFEPPIANMEQKNISQRIFVLGDSLSAGYQLAYEASYPAQLEQLLRNNGKNITVINGGESGDTSEGLKSRIDWVTADAQSGDIALIVIGGNDGLQGLSTENLQNNIVEIVDALQQRGLKTVIGGMQIPTNLGETYRTDFANVYPNAAKNTNSLLIPFILSGVAGDPSLNLRDGIHPNETGQRIVAQTVYDVVISLIP